VPKIDKVFVFIAEKEPGNEGVVQLLTGPAPEKIVRVPLMAINKEGMESLIPQAQAMSNAMNKPIKVKVFSTPEEVATLWPQISEGGEN